VLLFVSPSNRLALCIAESRSRRFGRVAVERGWWVLTDEIYEHLVYEGHSQHSMPVVVPELAERCIVANGGRQDLRDDRFGVSDG